MVGSAEQGGALRGAEGHGRWPVHVSSAGRSRQGLLLHCAHRKRMNCESVLESILVRVSISVKTTPVQVCFLQVKGMAKNRGIPLPPREEVQNAGSLKLCLVHP